MCPLPVLPAPIGRTLDPTFLNMVANHPDVRPWLGGDGPLDLTPVITNVMNITVVTEHGGFIAEAQGYGRYEVHSMFLPNHGPDAIHAMRAGLEYMFTTTEALELVTKLPAQNPAAAALALRAGFEKKFTGAVQWNVGTRVDTVFAGLTLDRWALRSATATMLGRWLHEQMELAKTAFHSTLGPHSDAEDMPAHDAVAGAAILMMRAGNARKAVAFYNEWARFAGFPVIALIREQPIVVDLGGMVAESRPEGMEILSCQ